MKFSQSQVRKGKRITTTIMKIVHVEIRRREEDFSSASVSVIHLLVEANRKKREREVNFVFSPARLRLGADYRPERTPSRRRRRRRDGRRRRGSGRGRGLGLGERPNVEGVKAAEAAEGKDDRSELGGGGAGVGPVPGADQLPEALVLRRVVPLLAHARRHGQGLRVHVLQHLEQEVVVQIHESATLPNPLWFFRFFHLRLYLLHLLILLFVAERSTLHRRIVILWIVIFFPIDREIDKKMWL